MPYRLAMGIALYDEELEKYLGPEFYEQICRFVRQGKLKPEREALEKLNRTLTPAHKQEDSRTSNQQAG